MPPDEQAPGRALPGLCAEHGGLMWSNAMRACITPDDVIRGGCRWQPYESFAPDHLATGDDDAASAIWVLMGGTGESWDVATEAHRDEYRALVRRVMEANDG